MAAMSSGVTRDAFCSARPQGGRVAESIAPPDREEKPASAPLDLIHRAVVRLLVGAPAQDSSPVAEMPVGDVIGTDFDDQL
jgi:hypothetical protein